TFPDQATPGSQNLAVFSESALGRLDDDGLRRALGCGLAHLGLELARRRALHEREPVVVELEDTGADVGADAIPRALAAVDGDRKRISCHVEDSIPKPQTESTNRLADDMVLQRGGGDLSDR